MIEDIKKLIIDLCKEDETWKRHVESVVKNSKLYGEKLGADLEILEVSAWLHDISKIKGVDDGHHIKGAEEAENILKEKGYPEDKIEAVKHCVLTHSSDENYPPVSLEAKTLASADAMDYFDDFIYMTYHANLKYGKDIDAQKEWLSSKLEKSWKKIMPEIKDMLKEKYEAIKLLLN